MSGGYRAAAVVKRRPCVDEGRSCRRQGRAEQVPSERGWVGRERARVSGTDSPHCTARLGGPSRLCSLCVVVWAETVSAGPAADDSPDVAHLQWCSRAVGQARRRLRCGEAVMAMGREGAVCTADGLALHCCLAGFTTPCLSRCGRFGRSHPHCAELELIEG